MLRAAHNCPLTSVKELENYSGPDFPPEIQALVDELRLEGFAVRTSIRGRHAAGKTRETVCVWWGDNYVGRIGPGPWPKKNPRLLGYQFFRGGVFDPTCPDECDGPAYAEVFAREHGIPSSSVHVKGPHRGSGRDNFYLSVRGHGAALHLMRETAQLLSDLEKGPSERDDPRSIALDIEKLKERVKKPTTLRRLVDARTCQGQFRTELLEDKELKRKCAVTGLNFEPVLKASHIVGFMDPTTCDEERIDKNNGLLLSANLDALFDRHLITFGADGAVRASILLSKAHADELGVGKLRIALNTERIGYLLRHGKVFDAKELRRIEALKRASPKVPARGCKAAK